MDVRRVVIANDENGDGKIVSDETLAAVSRGVGTNITGAEMWSTDMMPIDNRPSADTEQRAGYIGVYNDYNYVGNGQGTTFRVTEWAPGHPRFTHRTQTTDYDVVLRGEIDLELDGGAVVHLRTGDAVILRGCTHTWVNRGSDLAVTAFMLIDAAPVETKRGSLTPIFPMPH